MDSHGLVECVEAVVPAVEYRQDAGLLNQGEIRGTLMMARAEGQTQGSQDLGDVLVCHINKCRITEQRQQSQRESFLAAHLQADLESGRV